MQSIFWDILLIKPNFDEPVGRLKIETTKQNYHITALTTYINTELMTVPRVAVFVA